MDINNANPSMPDYFKYNISSAENKNVKSGINTKICNKLSNIF